GVSQGSRRPRGTRALTHSPGLHPGAQRPPPPSGNGSLRPLRHPRRPHRLPPPPRPPPPRPPPPAISRHFYVGVLRAYLGGRRRPCCGRVSGVRQRRGSHV